MPVSVYPFFVTVYVTLYTSLYTLVCVFFVNVLLLYAYVMTNKTFLIEKLEMKKKLIFLMRLCFLFLDVSQ